MQLTIPNGSETQYEFSSDSIGLEGDESEDSTANGDMYLLNILRNQFFLQICLSLRCSNPRKVWGKSVISSNAPYVLNTLRFCASALHFSLTPLS
ncbi:MAG: hypothetical protein LBS83_01850 [Holosporales bacterium]|nr:hypothetical protein [Holosporales bacterium]